MSYGIQVLAAIGPGPERDGATRIADQPYPAQVFDLSKGGQSLSVAAS